MVWPVLWDLKYWSLTGCLIFLFFYSKFKNVFIFFLNRQQTGLKSKQKGISLEHLIKKKIIHLPVSPLLFGNANAAILFIHSKLCTSLSNTACEDSLWAKCPFRVFKHDNKTFGPFPMLNNGTVNGCSVGGTGVWWLGWFTWCFITGATSQDKDGAVTEEEFRASWE